MPCRWPRVKGEIEFRKSWSFGILPRSDHIDLADPGWHHARGSAIPARGKDAGDASARSSTDQRAKVLLDGPRTCAASDPAELRRHIGFVPQENSSSARPSRDIAFGWSTPTVSRIRRAADGRLPAYRRLSKLQRHGRDAASRSPAARSSATADRRALMRDPKITGS